MVGATASFFVTEISIHASRGESDQAGRGRTLPQKETMGGNSFGAELFEGAYQEAGL